MQLTQQRNPVQITGDNVQTQQFRIQFNAKMARILSDGLYSDKILAIIRELSTNAYDSHIAAGKPTVPFQVTLPSSLSPQFIIEDFGVGLTPDQVNNIYTVYGASDKENSNNSIGCLGLGSKTPFSYNTRSCTIESRTDGMAYIYSAFIGENGLPTLAKLNENKTTKPNGVKITIPVSRSDIYNFSNKAKEVYEWFNPRPTIFGQTLTFDQHQVVVKGTDWELRNVGKCSAIMGSISYPIQFSDSALKPEEVKMMGHPFYIKFPIGDLDIEVSREGLSYDLRTRSAITAKFKLIRSELATKVNDDIDQCPSLWEARLKVCESTGVLYEYVDRNKLEWKKQKIVNSTSWNSCNYVELPKGEKIGQYNTYYRSAKNFKPKDVEHIEINRHIKIMVDDIPKGTDSRILGYTKTHGISSSRIYLIKDTQRKMVVDALGMLDDSQFILVSSLPKPVPKARTYTGTGVKRGHTESVMEMKQGGNTLSSFYQNVQKDLDEGGKYVEFNTFKCLHSGAPLEPSMVIKMRDSLEACGIKQTDPIYAVKTAQVKRLAKAAKPWTGYIDYALAELDKAYANLGYTNLDKVKETLQWFGRWDYNVSNNRILELSILEELAKYVTKKKFVDLISSIGDLKKIESQNTVKEAVEKMYNMLGRPIPQVVGKPKDAALLCVKVKDNYNNMIQDYPLFKNYYLDDITMCKEVAIYMNAKP